MISGRAERVGRLSRGVQTGRGQRFETVILRARFRKFGHVLFSTESLSPVRCHGGTGLRAGHEPVAGRDAGPTDPLG
jgi:hypothetical protein